MLFRPGMVVSDPVQAGVMAIMAVADTAKFTAQRLRRRVFWGDEERRRKPETEGQNDCVRMDGCYRTTSEYSRT